MQSFYPAWFEREMGCTEAEWLSWLPRAMGAHPHQRVSQSATAQIGTGRLVINWQVVEPRALGAFRLPRLRVRFEFSDLGDDERFTFMKRFDLYTQRGGG